MPKVIIDINCCKGCGLCVEACPKQILKLDAKTINKKGYHPSSCIDMEQCIGCAFCATMCPDVCIKVEK